MTSKSEMRVLKRNGKYEEVSFDKILVRVKSLGTKHKLSINYTNLVIKIIEQLYDKISTSLIDELTAEQAASMCVIHPDFQKLAGALVISNLHKKTSSDFVKTMNNIYNFRDINDEKSPLLSKKFVDIVNKHDKLLNNLINYENDYLIDYFGFKTLERAYLMKINKHIVERPQHMWLRVAIGIHMDDFEGVKQTYNLMSQKYFTHATPTLFNAGTPRPQLSSCYLIAMENDSIEGIFDTLKDCAQISKWAGGIGMHIHNIRAKGSHIRGTNGISNGIVPMLSVFNKTARYIDQGGGRRNGSFAIYLEPHHPDIEVFLDLKKNHGDEELRARDLFYALWISDLFMERVEKNKDWCLFCPDSAPGLCDCFGDNYKKLYEKYESEKRYISKVKARDIWIKILDAQMETGTPYILYKDSINKKSNQKNLGVIKSSNLCCEICEYSDENETAVCNLASIALNKCVVVTESTLNNVEIYTKSKCSWCVLLKGLLKRKNIKYSEIKLDNKEKFEEYKEKFNVRTVPLLLNNKEKIGGFNDVQEILRRKFDYAKLYEITQILTDNLNKVIDINFYPTEKTERSNILHRPIGIGVQGLADTFALMDLPFHSEQAKEINRKIFETIYYAALEKSMQLSMEREKDLKILQKEYLNGKWEFTSHDVTCRKYYVDAGWRDMDEIDRIEKLLEKNKPIRAEMLREGMLGTYSSFIGSPASNGILQFDLWKSHSKLDVENYLFDLQWDDLKSKIKKYGLRNSLLVAPMPTASTSQILGNNECFEPFTSNIYTRRTLAGEFILINKYLINDLLDIGMWDVNMKNNIILNKGSIQNIKEIPEFLRNKYKIVWEIPMKHVIEMSRDRGRFICQSQSLNLWIEDPTPKALTNMHFYTWKSGLKTGIYYLRRKPKHHTQQFTIDPTLAAKNESNTINANNDNEEEPCESCSG